MRASRSFARSRQRSVLQAGTEFRTVCQMKKLQMSCHIEGLTNASYLREAKFFIDPLLALLFFFFFGKIALIL